MTQIETYAGRAPDTLSALPRRLLQAFVARSAQRRSLAAMRRLDDRLLRDVGLTRADMLAMTEKL